MNAKTAQSETQVSKKKVSKLRMMAGVLLGALGLSLAASLMPAVASADPYDPYSGPLHPVRHYEIGRAHV